MSARRMGGLLFLVAAVAAGTGCGGGGGNAGSIVPPGAQLVVEPPAQALTVGSKFQVTVIAQARIAGVYGGGFELHYDPAKLAYQSTDTSRSQLQATKDAVALKDGQQGAIVFARSKEGATTPGNAVLGEIARFEFTALAAGSAEIDMTDLLLVDGSGATIRTNPPVDARFVIAK